ncbi:hypothetical protein HXX76_007880 [Chlamydomonas incerta]|uniref:Myb-like domain-containing protein n=1 Tax=Chlamydomonas incerta TaxID=51695 RepID=A0A835SW30_CHLIN|nr:hypothetical protein HXX76_007880 [Chlamydomonas incerta]|eukprot:KAG2434153.1 hypothetical protein HXX76_007880 [Chlamydomonas incerta]
MKKLKFRLKLGAGIDWEALGPIPEPFPFCIDANCTTLAFKHYLSHKILKGVLEPGSLQLRLQGSDRELEDVADAEKPTSSTRPPRLRLLADQNVRSGSVVQLDVCATEEEVQRFLDEAAARAEANELEDLEEAKEPEDLEEAEAEAQTQPLHATEAADHRQRQPAAGGGAVDGGEAPAGRPSLGVMHTPAYTVGTFIDDDDAASLQEDLEGLEQPPQQQGGQHQAEELDGPDVAPEGEPLVAEGYEEQGDEGRGACGGMEGPKQRQPHFEGAEDEAGADLEDLGLRPAAAPPAGRPVKQAAAAQQHQPLRPKASPHAAAAKRPREEEAEEFDFVSASEDNGADPPRQQQRTHGAAAGTPRRPMSAHAAGAGAGALGRQTQQQQQQQRAPAGLPPQWRPAVDTGAFSGAGGFTGRHRASPGFWSLEETIRLVDWVQLHGAGDWTAFAEKNRDLRRNPEQVKMRWRNLRAASEKGWREMRRIVLPPDLRARIDSLV